LFEQEQIIDYHEVGSFDGGAILSSLPEFAGLVDVDPENRYR
jgi:hypothetical protein